ncbi:MAG: hypothetical protein OEY19_06615 [Gammaproteobacteria bacterium]|nr:hypothetical protein [Gammaproteobacteria bacterium]MDH5630937.1 hypothetical protein [Gammaproteobacteria bacterium]
MKRLLFIFVVLNLVSGCVAHVGTGTGGTHVGVGVHGEVRGGKNVVGALIVGGLIGHALTEAAHENEEKEKQQAQQKSGSQNNTSANRTPEQSRFYQMGEDGNCYLVESVDGGLKVISQVPKYTCG